MVERQQEDTYLEVQSKYGSDKLATLGPNMSQVTNVSEMEIKKRVSKSEGDSATKGKIFSRDDLLANLDSSEVKSASPDSGCAGEDHLSDTEDGDEVFFKDISPTLGDKDFETIELNQCPSPTNKDMILDIHRVYMSQFSNSTTADGQDNLAFITEEPEDGDRNDAEKETTLALSHLPKVDTAQSSLSLADDSFLENEHRKVIRSLRRKVQTGFAGQKTIGSPIFVEVFSKKVAEWGVDNGEEKSKF